MAALSSLCRKAIYRNRNLRRILAAQSAFKVFFVLCFAFACEAGMCLLFAEGFRFLDGLGGVGLMIVGRLFSLFFLGMGMMLVFSGLVTSYATMYRSEEIPFLIVRPYEMSQIVVYKFLESSALSSWAFFFIVIPFVGAFAWHEQLSPLFALATVMFSIPFLVLCSGIGTLGAMLMVRWSPTGRAVKVVVALAAAAAFGVLWYLAYQSRGPEGEFQFNLTSFVPGLKLASNRLIPSWWVAEGIRALARGEWGRGFMLWLVLVSTALAMGTAVEWLGGRSFYDGWQRVVGARGSGKRRPILLPVLDRWLAPLPADIRAMVLKDVRTFFRDPMQWSQALIFFGLLAIYFANLRTFRYHFLPDNWRNTVAFLNVFSVAAVMCSLGSRFIYPQLSLEGQGFWILGLSPTTKGRILMTKFLLGLCGMLVVSIVLMLLSCTMLKADLVTRRVALGLACAVSLAICALSTGLGAVFLDLRQRNPAAIVSGFGGTLNLVLTLAFMLLAIFPFGFVFHLRVIGVIGEREHSIALLVAGLWLCLITAFTTVFPLWAGRRSLLNREF